MILIVVDGMTRLRDVDFNGFDVQTILIKESEIL
jgi:hypothetical protein